ncbi:MAG: hypothetical protein WCK65_08750 [Rhodospirillaceae bacterium]
MIKRTKQDANFKAQSTFSADKRSPSEGRRNLMMALGAIVVLVAGMAAVSWLAPGALKLGGSTGFRGCSSPMASPNASGTSACGSHY